MRIATSAFVIMLGCGCGAAPDRDVACAENAVGVAESAQARAQGSACHFRLQVPTLRPSVISVDYLQRLYASAEPSLTEAVCKCVTHERDVRLAITVVPDRGEVRASPNNDDPAAACIDGELQDARFVAWHGLNSASDCIDCGPRSYRGWPAASMPSPARPRPVIATTVPTLLVWDGSPPSASK